MNQSIKSHLLIFKLNSIYSFLFAILIIVPDIITAGEIDLTRSKFIQLAKHLEIAEEELKYEFSRIALLEMYYTYEDEIRRSFEQPSPDPQKKLKVRQWRYATQSYLEQLDHLMLLMDSGIRTDYFINPQNKIVLLIDGHPVIISGANSGANKMIETRVVEQFCSLFDCREYFEQPVPKQTIHTANSNKNTFVYDGGVSGSWSVNQKMTADFETSNGIVFQFNSMDNKGKKEQWALGISEEVDLISENFQTLKTKNTPLQWEYIEVHDLPITDNAYKLQLNSKGHYIKLPIPLIGPHKDLFKALLFWLREQYDKNRKSRIIIENADRFYKN